MIFKKIKFSDAMLNDDLRLYIQQLAVYILLGTVSLIMTIVNLITGKEMVLWATFAYTILCGINIIMHIFKNLPRKIASYLFIIESIVLFTFFLITGSPNGFSALWIPMLPSFGLLIYKRKIGSIFAGLMFIVLVFFLWIPAGRNMLQYDYGNTFCLRFPILYVAFFLLAFFLETVRSIIYRELVSSKDKYEYLYLHDALTDVYNRYGFYQKQQELFKTKDSNVALAILDLDAFKTINDTYGHENGDIVLQTLVYTIQKVIDEDEVLCRWGGDEFVVLFKDSSKSLDLCNKILDEVRKCRFNFSNNTIGMTISVGLVIGENEEKIDISEIAKQADANLYVAKENGKNCVVSSKYTVKNIEQ